MISGLVAYLSADAGHAEAALHEIRQQSTIELGARDGLRQPLVLETETSAESQAKNDWLKELPGVEHVDVVFVHLEEPHSAEPSTASQSNPSSDGV